MKEGFVDIG